MKTVPRRDLNPVFSEFNTILELAIRKFYLYDPPPVVTIVLKRFAQKSSGRFEKIAEHVEIPEFLDLSSYVLLKGKQN